MIVIEFEPFHAELIKLRPEQTVELGQFMKCIDQLNNTYAWTGVMDGNVIACGGMLPLLPGNGEIWALFSTDLHKHAVSVVKALKTNIAHLHDCGWDRLQTVVQSDFTTAKRFVERLGFTNEGTMKKYMNGISFDRYAKVVGGE